MSYTAPPSQPNPQSHPSDYDFFSYALSDAWKLTTSRFAEYFVMGIVIVLAEVFVQSGYSLFTLGFTFEGLQGYDWFTPGWFLDYGFSFIGYGVAGILLGGLNRYAIKHARGEEVSLADFTAGMQPLVSLFFGGLLVGAITEIGMLFCCLPGLVFGGIFMLVVPLIVDRNLGPIEAISESWRMLAQHWFRVAVFYLVMGIIAGLGVLACGIGVFFTFSLLYVAFAVIYVRLTSTPVVATSVSPYPRAGGATTEYGSQPVPPPNEQEPPKPEDVS